MAGYLKLAIVMPSHENVPVFFAYDLALLVRDTSMAIEAQVKKAEKAVQAEVSRLVKQRVPPKEALARAKDEHGFDAFFGIELLQGTYVHSARQELMDRVLADGVTHVLWLDTDMRFPPDALVRLLNHDLPVVGINYAKRRVPPDFVAIKTIGWNDGEASKKLVTDENSTGLEEVEAIGFGMVMMQTAALKNMPDPKDEPWFWFKWMKDKNQQVGEDVWFCKLLRDSGVPIYVDHDLSKECGHIGQFTYKLDHVLLTRPEPEEVAA